MRDLAQVYHNEAIFLSVRLKNAYIIMCTGCKKNEAGDIEEIYAEYDPESRSGMAGYL